MAMKSTPLSMRNCMVSGLPEQAATWARLLNVPVSSLIPASGMPLSANLRRMEVSSWAAAANTALLT